ncbi:DUF721 domain-containing protein [Phaeovulum sp. W22_SRMD_FR3]|uniref:DUF721 domain-containing protein n=1 Tax=Phaeovulum sp. W22_SRMD_FR3 TaxID=3240274 RepID=UPI003F977B0D
MAAKPTPPKTPFRRMRGFEPAAGLMRERIRTAGEARGFAVARLLTHWAEVVGEEIAARARPVKVGYGKGAMGATLTLLTTGAAAPMLQMQLPAIRDKVNACYGYNAISKVILTQTAPTGFAEGQAQFAPAPKAVKPPPDPEICREAQATAAPVGDSDLRAALELLAQNVLTKEARRRLPPKKG